MGDAMNERLKELGIQAGGIWIEHATAFLSGTLNLERFAELVRQDEREAMRILLADQARSYQQANDFVSFLALSTLDMAIRTRGNHDTER